jgi:hypothetical protein
MSLRALDGCRFEATVDPNVVRTGLKIPYDWKLEDVQPIVPAALISGTCAASEHIERFVPIKGKFTPNNDGILVRFLLDEKGKTFGIKVEETHPAPVSIATAYIQSCRFSPAMLDGKPVHGNISGWLVLVRGR